MTEEHADMLLDGVSDTPYEHLKVFRKASLHMYFFLRVQDLMHLPLPSPH
jgi:hypothetical protein